MKNIFNRYKEKYSVNNEPYRLVWCPIFKASQLVSTILWVLTWIFLILGLGLLIIQDGIPLIIDILLLVLVLVFRFQNWKFFL